MTLFDWTCPYCNRIATITDLNFRKKEHIFSSLNTKEHLALVTTIIICPNPECHEYTITADLCKTVITGNKISRAMTIQEKDPIQTWDLKPQSHAKQFPNYIPQVIIADYKEACLIQNLSPKASATLSRRCLQGIIRDFWGVKKGNLYEEINAIQGKVDPQTWQAIDAVRSVGNIGAHMEKDINFIIDVAPNEAEALIKLIEILIKDWYIARQERENALASVIGIGKQKSREQKGNKQT